MEKVKIAGREVFPLGLGTLNMGDNLNTMDEEIKALQTGLDNGVQLIDTAEMYGNGNSEKLVSQAIKPYLQEREELFLISKVLPNNASEKQLPVSLDNSLKRLGVDYLDLYLLHWQVNIPLQESVEALEKARIQGKIKSWGVSNLDVDDMKKVMDLPEGIHCSTNQVRYNLADRGIEYDLMPWMKKHEMPVIAYAPVDRRDSSGSKLTHQKVLEDIAEKHQASVHQILLAWCMRNGSTIAIPQSSNPEHVLSNVNASNVKLDLEDLHKIDKTFPKPTSKQPLALW